jgi:hypothetical protein
MKGNRGRNMDLVQQKMTRSHRWSPLITNGPQEAGEDKAIADESGAFIKPHLLWRV